MARHGLASINLTNLKRYARNLGIRGASRIRKDDLVNAMIRIGVKDEHVDEKTIARVRRIYNIDIADYVSHDINPQILTVFDMDNTLIGNSMPLAHRDAVEKEIKWKWPENFIPGITIDTIVNELQHGLLRPGVVELFERLYDLGATIVVYTCATRDWANEIIEAIERIIGYPVVYRIFARGPEGECMREEWETYKRLDHILDKLKRENGLEWVNLDRTVLVDDRDDVLPPEEREHQLVVVPYEWEDPDTIIENITEEIMDKNPQTMLKLRNSLKSWGYASHKGHIVTPGYHHPAGDNVMYHLLQTLQEAKDALEWPRLRLPK